MAYQGILSKYSPKKTKRYDHLALLEDMHYEKPTYGAVKLPPLHHHNNKIIPYGEDSHSQQVALVKQSNEEMNGDPSFYLDGLTLYQIKRIEDVIIDYDQALAIKRGSNAIIPGDVFKCRAVAPHLADYPLVLKRLD